MKFEIEEEETKTQERKETNRNGNPRPSEHPSGLYWRHGKGNSCLKLILLLCCSTRAAKMFYLIIIIIPSDRARYRNNVVKNKRDLCSWFAPSRTFCAKCIISIIPFSNTRTPDQINVSLFQIVCCRIFLNDYFEDVKFQNDTHKIFKCKIFDSKVHLDLCGGPPDEILAFRRNTNAMFEVVFGTGARRIPNDDVRNRFSTDQIGSKELWKDQEEQIFEWIYRHGALF
jgi:hypothetical protein